MKLIDADKFLSYLIFSKHIDSLTCGEVKEAVEMCKVDIEPQEPTTDERKCELVKIVAASDIGKRLVNDKVTYLLDKQTMTVYAPWANCEMLYALGLTIVDLPEGSEE